MNESHDPLKPDTCPACGTTLAGGLCPRCLMADAAQATQAPGTAPGGALPSLAEVAAAFPQLEIIELIGAGGMGNVWCARQPTLDRFVALKLLPASITERDPAFAERFAREGQLLARLHHPNIVTVHDSGRAGEFFYLIMEYVDGVNLRQAMRASRFTAEQALAIVPKICDALQYAHEEGVLHRDIKPENILLDAKGRVKLVDFGIAKLMAQTEAAHAGGEEPSPSASLTMGGTALGTPQYMAPEQRERPGDVDQRADIYSLGVVFYELLTGELPVGLFAPPSERSEADPRLDGIVRQALERQRERRQGSVSELRTQVDTVLHAPCLAGPAVACGFGNQESWEYKSARLVLGLPLLHVVAGIDPATRRMRVARGFFAFGGLAEGIFAIGGRAKGVFAFGGVATGVVAVGGLAMGLISLGGLALGFLLAFGGLGIAPVATGGGAIGWYASGGEAWGYYAQGGVAVGKYALGDKAVAEHVMKRAEDMPAVLQMLGQAMPWVLLGYVPFLILLSVITVVVPLWARRKAMESGQFSGMAGPSGPRLSRAAIWAALWILALPAGQVINNIVIMAFTPLPKHGPMRWIIGMPGVALIGLGVIGVLGATILGWMAVTHIRRSEGKLHGMWLAVFDGLVWPLLALDVLLGQLCKAAQDLFVTFYDNPSALNDPRVHPPFATRLANDLRLHDDTYLMVWAAMAIVVDLLIVQAVWRAVNLPLPGSGATAQDSAPGGSRMMAGIAMCFAGLSGLLGTLAFFGMPEPSRLLVLAILMSALIGIALAFSARRTALGKQALMVGCANTALWLIMACISMVALVSVPSSAAAFGPVMEKTLPFDRSFIDFQTGNVLRPTSEKTPPFSPEDWDAWIARTGADAMVEEVSPSQLPSRNVDDFPRLVAPQRAHPDGKPDTVFVSEGDADFESARPGDADEKLKEATAKKLSWNLAHGPHPWWFKTADGAEGLLQILGVSDNPRGLKIRYKLLVPATAAAQARSRFPHAACISRDHHSVMVVHDDVDLHYVFCYAGDFNTSSSGSQNEHSRAWMDEGGITLDGNGRSFGYHRESTDPDHLRVNGKEYDLRQGRVFALRDDGGVEQRSLQVSLQLAHDPAGLATYIANHTWAADANSAAKLSFGPVVEREVDGAIDFDTGKVAALPEKFSESSDIADNVLKAVAWLEHGGLDAITEPSRSLKGVGMKAKMVDKDAWNHLTPEQVVSAIKGIKRETWQDLDPDRTTPLTWVFETREGGKGILQALGEATQGMKVRYKLLAPVSAADDSISLEQAVNDFDKRYHEAAVAAGQPPLTVEAVLTAIRSAMADRAQLSVTNKTFGTLGSIIETKVLPKDFDLELLTSYEDDETTKNVWSVRLRIPGTVIPGGTTCITIHELLLSTYVIGEQERKVIHAWQEKERAQGGIELGEGMQKHRQEREAAAAIDARNKAAAAKAPSHDSSATPAFQMRWVVDAPSDDAEPMVLVHKRNDPGAKETLQIDKMVLLDQSALKSASVVADAVSKAPRIQVVFSEAGRRRFAELTRASKGRRLAMVIGGALCCAPNIVSEIAGGTAEISGNFSEEEAKALAAKITEALPKL